MTREEAINNIKNGLIEGNYPLPKEIGIEALNMAIKALEQELTTKNDLEVDCIDRTRAIERLKLNLPIAHGAADNLRDRHRYMQALADIQAIRELPSVTPQEPKSEWQRDHEILKAYSDGANEVLDKIRAEIENHCGLAKENHCRYCSYCNNLMGIREILEIIDKYKAENEE